MSLWCRLFCCYFRHRSVFRHQSSPLQRSLEARHLNTKRFLTSRSQITTYYICFVLLKLFAAWNWVALLRLLKRYECIWRQHICTDLFVLCFFFLFFFNPMISPTLSRGPLETTVNKNKSFSNKTLKLEELIIKNNNHEIMSSLLESQWKKTRKSSGSFQTEIFSFKLLNLWTQNRFKRKSGQMYG